MYEKNNKKVINLKKKQKKSRIKSKEIRKILKKINLLKEKKIIWILIGIVLLIVGINILIQKTIYKPENTIKEVSFTKSDMGEYDNPYLYKDIQDELEGKNYYYYKFFKLRKFHEKLKDKYFIIEKIKVQKTKNGKYLINIDFLKPDIILKDGVRNIGMINGNFFDIYEGNSIGSGIISISIPNYTQNLKTFDGFFNKVSKEDLLLQINTLNIFFEGNISNIEYLPGGSKTIVTTLDGKKIFFNNIKPLSEQLEKLNIYQNNNTLYKKYNEIDLGSLDEIIVK